MNLQKISTLCKQNGFAHVIDFKALVDCQPAQEDALKGHWGSLVPDQNFSAFTTRERRILRYLSRGDEMIINRNCIFTPKAVYDVDYVRGDNVLTYVDESLVSSALMAAILKADMDILRPLMNQDETYQVDVNLFRVKAENGRMSPTTSGAHQDGVDWVAMHFIDAQNIVPVISEILAIKNASEPIWSSVLSLFLETIIVNDKRLFHRASPVQQVRCGQVGWRDMMIITISHIAD